MDDPLLYLLADPRRVRSVVSDGLWVRLVDVGSALAQRHYASPVDVVIEVADELCPQNACRWRLAAEAGVAPAGFRATCERTTAPADVVLPVWAVGAAYLGGTRAQGHGQRGPDHRSDARFPRGALHRNVVGTGTLVPHDLLTWRRPVRDDPRCLALLPDCP